jgi:hypothetical protein
MKDKQNVPTPYGVVGLMSLFPQDFYALPKEASRKEPISDGKKRNKNKAQKASRKRNRK